MANSSETFSKLLLWLYELAIKHIRKTCISIAGLLCMPPASHSKSCDWRESLTQWVFHFFWILTCMKGIYAISLSLYIYVWCTPVYAKLGLSLYRLDYTFSACRVICYPILKQDSAVQYWFSSISSKSLSETHTIVSTISRTEWVSCKFHLNGSSLKFSLTIREINSDTTTPSSTQVPILQYLMFRLVNLECCHLLRFPWPLTSCSWIPLESLLAGALPGCVQGVLHDNIGRKICPSISWTLHMHLQK